MTMRHSPHTSSTGIRRSQPLIWKVPTGLTRSTLVSLVSRLPGCENPPVWASCLKPLGSNRRVCLKPQNTDSKNQRCQRSPACPRLEGQQITSPWYLQDTTWLDLYLSHIPHVVYQVDDPENTVGAQHATLANKGNEAMGYLQFIIDYYDKLPASIVFLHGHR